MNKNSKNTNMEKNINKDQGKNENKKIVIKKYKFLPKKYINPMILKLIKEYPTACCSLNYLNPLQLTIALILAAQSTDNIVNQVLPTLFFEYPDVYALAKANAKDIEKIVKPCGYYRNKAKNIVLTANDIITKYNAKVPNTMEKLCTLHGIGRKSSNIVLQECFDKIEGIAVDTHVTRLSYRIGLSNNYTQIKIEKDLISKIDKKYWSKINHLFVFHGRATCTAKNPKCDNCCINSLCKKNMFKS